MSKKPTKKIKSTKGRLLKTVEGKATIDEFIGDDRVIEEEELAQVNYSLGATLSLGNYEFARVDVGIQLPAREGSISKTLDKAKGIVTTEIAKEIQKIRKIGGLK